MRLRLNRWGHSLGFRIPKHLAEELSLHADSEIECNIQDGKLVIKPIFAPEYTLDELLADEIDPALEIDWGRPMGREVW